MSAFGILSALGIEGDSNVESHCIQTLIMKCTGAIRTFEVDQQVMAHLSQVLKYFVCLLNDGRFNPLIMLPNDYLLYHLRGDVQPVALNTETVVSSECTTSAGVPLNQEGADPMSLSSGPLKHDALLSESHGTEASLARCAHCKEILFVPIIIYPCTHVVCSTCIEKGVASIDQRSFSCPACTDRIGLALVDAILLEETQTRLITRCPYAQKGCTFSDTLFKLYNDHIITCPHRFSVDSSPNRTVQRHIFLTLIAHNDTLLQDLSLDEVTYSTASALVRDCIQDQLITELHSPHNSTRLNQSDSLMRLNSGRDESHAKPQATSLAEDPIHMLTELLQLSFHAKSDQDYIMNGINESNETLRQVKNFINELAMTMSRFLNGKAICLNCKQLFEESPLSVAALASLGNSTLESGSTGESPDATRNGSITTKEKGTRTHLHEHGQKSYTSPGTPSSSALQTELPLAYERLLERIDALEKEVIQKSEQLHATQRTLEEASLQSVPNVSVSAYMALKNENEKLRAELNKSSRPDGNIDQLISSSTAASGITTALTSATHMSVEVAEQLKLEMDKKENSLTLLIKEMETKQDTMQRTIAELQKSNIILKAENRKLTDKNCALKEDADRLRQERDLLYKQSEKDSGLTVEEFRKVYMEYQVLKDKFGKLTKEYAALSDVFAKGDQSRDASIERNVMAEISTISLIRYILNPVPLPNSSSTLSIFANESRRRVKIGVNHAEDKEKRLRAFMELFGMIRAFYMLDYKRIRIDDFLYSFEVEGMPQGEIYSIAARTELMNTVKRLTRENSELLKKLDK